MPNIDKIILRQIYLQRYGTGYAGDLLKLHSSGDAELLAFVRAWADDASDADIAALIRANNRNASAKAFSDEFSEILSKQTTLTQARIVEEMTKLSESEAAATFKALDAAAVTIKAADVIKQPIVGEGLVAGWQTHRERTAKYLKNAIVTALNEGADPHLALRGTKSAQYKDGALYTRNLSIKQLAETQVNSVAANTRGDVYAKLRITEEDFLATLDHRTCIRCATAEANGPYKLGEGPMPALHPRCRCLRVPSGYVTERPFVEDERSVKDIPKDERKDKIGVTKLGYADFFERQSDSAKRGILGATRYDLYKSGELKITEFVSDNSRSILTIDALDAKYGLALK